MKRSLLALILLAALAPVPRDAVAMHPSGDHVARAGAAKVDSSWHVGASAGQYASDGFAAGSHGVEPHQHQVRRSPSYGLQSRNWARALVVEGVNGTRVALVSNDLYIPQDLLNRRVGGLLEEFDTRVSLGLEEGPPTGITDANMTVSVSHSHSSPYYSTPSWGVWAFQDVFDFRFFEYVAGRMAEAVIQATRKMVPVRMGASVSYFDALHRHSFGPQVADDGTPAGYPETDNEDTVTVLRFDDVSDAHAPKPLATWVVYGLHPEMLDGNDLLTGEYVNTMYRIVDREIGGVTLFSQNNTGTAEPARDARAHPPAQRAEYSHREYAQMERAARILADAVEDTRADIEKGTPEFAGQFAPFVEAFEVDISDIRFAPPSLRLLPSVSNCRMEKTFDGNPGIPIAGLPDCEYPAGNTVKSALGQFGVDPGVTYDTLRAAGIPVPDNLSAPSYTGLEETLQVHLQAIRMGGVGITVCPCEQWADQSRNIRSRLNKVDGDFWDGFDWSDIPGWCTQNGDTTWTCLDPRNPSRTLNPVSDESYRRMRAQIHNDARGWEDLAYAPYAETEEVDVAKIKGNFTHEELTKFGYDLVVPVGMANDYWGYLASYREYQRGDHYRKALTGLGPHSQDYMATRLSRMAASLNGGPPVELSVKDLAYSPEDVHEKQRAQVLGNIARAYVPVYEALLPADGGTPGFVQQPSSIERFAAAHVKWVGGSNWFDLPDARVERLEGDAWVPYGDGSGEVQIKANYPQPEQLPTYRLGQFEWVWEATFEAFCSDVVLPDASGEPRRCTPAGIYRFVVDGVHNRTPYHLASGSFDVRAWDGITVPEIRVDADATVSFTIGPVGSYTYGSSNTYKVGPIDYPDTYASPFRFIQGRDRPSNLKTYGPGLADDEQFCLECSFRPWKDAGAVASAALTVRHSDGSSSSQPATLGADGRWHGSGPLLPGDVAYVAPGGIVDEYAQVNGEPSAEVGIGSFPVCVDVDITGTGYAPFNFTVYVECEVRFTNRDSAARTVTAGGGEFDSGLIVPGASWTYHANTIGSFNFHDATRPYVIGVVNVVS